MHFLRLANNEEGGPTFSEPFPLITSAEVLSATTQPQFFTNYSTVTTHQLPAWGKSVFSM